MLTVNRVIQTAKLERENRELKTRNQDLRS